jgi:hypothetical protein
MFTLASFKVGGKMTLCPDPIVANCGVGEFVEDA